MTLDALDLVEDLADAREAIPIASARWSVFSEQWFSDPSRYRVLRGGNGTGKSWTQAAEIVWRATGTHPFRETKPPPARLAAYGFSHSSLEALMTAVWHLGQGTGIVRGGYDPGRGITGKPPRLVWGNGSVLMFLTYSQNSQAYAGKSLDYQALDEPCPASKWGEIEGRTREAGEVGLTLTPTPEAPSQAWVEEMCKQGLFSLTVAPLCLDPDRPETITLDAVTPRGGRPWLSEARIAKKIQRWLPLERRMRCGLSWEAIAVGRQLDGFQPRHYESWFEPAGEVVGCVATDHGIEPGRQATVLVASDGYRFWVLGVYRPSHKAPRTSTAQDAQGVVRLLADAAGWSPETRLLWVGDRAAESKKWAGRKENGLLAHAIADTVGKPLDALNAGRGLFIKVPHKPPGSVTAGLRVLNNLFIEDRIRLYAPRCQPLIDAIKEWEGSPKDRRKDLIDALRYGIDTLHQHFQDAARPAVVLTR